MTNQNHILHIQYPVGQGGLHLGIIGDVAYIYDCGSVKKSRLIKEIKDIRTRLKDTDISVIYVFISHLHSDHCNGIEIFIKELYESHIKTPLIFCLPYISNIEKICLCLDASKKDKDIITVLEKVVRKYSDNIKLVYIKDSESKTNSEKEQTKTIITYDKFNEQNNIFDVFVYNSFDSIKIKDFENKVREIFGKEISELVLSDFESIFTDLKIRKKLQNEYKTLAKNINFTSLCLYVEKKLNIADVSPDNYGGCCGFCQCCAYLCNPHGITSWLHTGDYNLTDNFKISFRKHYNTKLQKVIFFQIPHHGSKENIDKDIKTITNDKSIMFLTGEICPYGKKQPSRDYVLFSQISNRWLVSECPYSKIIIKKRSKNE